MLGLSGVWAIVNSLARGQAMEQLTLTEFPNMPFLYWMAVAGAAAKPRWTDSKAWPAIRVTMATPHDIKAERLARFRGLTGWPAAAPGSLVPGMFLMAESFKLVMQVLTMPAFPVSVLGTVVNKRAKYVYLRPVADSETITYSCTLNPAVRETFSGHAEFDVLLEAVSHEKGDVVWQALLSLVLMNPRKKGGKKESGGTASSSASAAPAARQELEPAAAAAAEGLEPVATWVLPEDTGRQYASLDGDISPMHLYKVTAMLMGFPAPVANVHLLAARAEASTAAKKGPDAPVAPFTLELEFKKPTLLPNELTLSGGKDQGPAGGNTLRLDDKKGRPIATGSVSSKAARTVL